MPNLEALPTSSSEPELLPQKPGQCLLSGFPGDGIFVSAPEGFPIWIDNLYIREGVLYDPLYGHLWGLWPSVEREFQHLEYTSHCFLRMCASWQEENRMEPNGSLEPSGSLFFICKENHSIEESQTVSRFQ
jgi:hypothetical protein